MIEKIKQGDFVSISPKHLFPRRREALLRLHSLPQSGTPHQGIVLKVMDVPGAPYGKMYEIFTCGNVLVYVLGFWKFKVLSRVNEEFNK